MAPAPAFTTQGEGLRSGAPTPRAARRRRARTLKLSALRSLLRFHARFLDHDSGARFACKSVMAEFWHPHDSNEEECDRNDAGVSRMPVTTGGAAPLAILAPVGEIDPLGTRRKGLDVLLGQKVEEGYVIETRSDTHAIIFRRPKGLKRFTSGRDPGRYVVQVDEDGIATMRPAEPRRT